MMSRRTAREIAIQTLYQMEFHPEDSDAVIRERGAGLTGSDRSFFQQLVQGVKNHLAVIDSVIGRFLKTGWSVERLSSVDRAILRLSVYELLFEKETPRGVVLNEAVELAKLFSGIESSRFINGVLGGIVRQLDEIRAELKSNSNETT
jgi:N utilization substance protein B